MSIEIRFENFFDMDCVFGKRGIIENNIISDVYNGERNSIIEMKRTMVNQEEKIMSDYYTSSMQKKKMRRMIWLLLEKCFILILMAFTRSEEHTSELQSRFDLVCRLLLEK